jgi:hypothetical protein
MLIRSGKRCICWLELTQSSCPAMRRCKPDVPHGPVGSLPVPPSLCLSLCLPHWVSLAGALAVSLSLSRSRCFGQVPGCPPGCEASLFGVTPSEDFLAAGNASGRAFVYDAHNGTLVCQLKVRANRPTQVATGKPPSVLFVGVVCLRSWSRMWGR